MSEHNGCGVLVGELNTEQCDYALDYCDGVPAFVFVYNGDMCSHSLVAGKLCTDHFVEFAQKDEYADLRARSQFVGLSSFRPFPETIIAKMGGQSAEEESGVQ